MATYRGNELPVPPQPETDLALAGPPLPGMENVEEELNMPPEAGPDYVPMPGNKGYMQTKPMAEMPLPNVGSNNIEDRRMMPPPEQGEGEDDRVEPTQEWKQQQLRGIEDAQRRGTLRTYEAGRDFGPQRAGPEFDSDFEPRRLKFGSDTDVRSKYKNR